MRSSALIPLRRATERMWSGSSRLTPPTLLFHVDSFTAKPFGGNPAAVCVLDAPADEEWMQQVATELNLSETAFVLPARDEYELRWFTPTAEVPLCGHATLASAHVLWDMGRVSPDTAIRFDTLSGVVTARKRESGIAIDLPVSPITPAPLPDRVSHALGIEAVNTGRTLDRGLGDVDYLVEVASQTAVREVQPDLRELATVPAGVIVTARAPSSPYDFISRYFAPWWGIDEDPVTGVAHTALAPYWSARLGKCDLVGYQASPRGGVVRMHVAGDRVELLGDAVTVFAGSLRV